MQISFLVSQAVHYMQESKYNTLYVNKAGCSKGSTVDVKSTCVLSIINIVTEW